MPFCEKCGYSYNITKDIKNKQSGGKTNTALNILFDKFATGDSISKSDLKRIKPTDIYDDERFDTLNKKNQKKMLSVVKAVDKDFFSAIDSDESESNSTTTVSDGAHFICKFCKHNKPIEPGTFIYSKTYNAAATTDLDDYTYMIHDMSLARTRAYNCPYAKCETHSKPAIKEAILTKNPTDQVIYVCTICGTDWINTV
jgi:hypothetical protein